MISIKIKKHDTKLKDFEYEADPIDQCGSPIVGRGSSPARALLDLILYNDKLGISILNETGEEFD